MAPWEFILLGLLALGGLVATLCAIFGRGDQTDSAMIADTLADIIDDILD